MKRCPKCNTVYDDTKNFCIKDGTQLVDHSGETENQDEPKPEPRRKRKGKSGKGRKMFRKIVLALIVIVVALYALSKWALNSATYLRLSPETQIFSRDKQVYTVNVETDGYTWEVIHRPDWVTILNEDTEANLLKISVMSNKGGDDREGTIEIKSGKCTAVMQVGQWAKAKKLECDKSELKFKRSPDSDSKKTIKVTSDTHDVSASCTSWMTVKWNGATMLNVTCEDNEGYARKGTITITADDLSRTITVRQQGKCKSCKGTGKTGSSITICPYCQSGRVYDIWGNSSICKHCGGVGWKASSKRSDCSSCKGTRYTY